MAEGLKVLVKKPTDVAVGDRVRVVPVVPKKLAAIMPADEKILTVTSIKEDAVGTEMGSFPVPPKAPMKFKLYRGAKKRGRTAKKKEGGRRRYTRRR